MALRVDTSQLTLLGKKLREIDPDAHKAMRKSMLASGKVIVADARTRASWSTRIPATVRQSVSSGGTLTVSAGNRRTAPHAKPYEHGGAQGTFRHPVFPDGDMTRDQWKWVSERARPFLHPAVTGRLRETADALADALSRAVDAAVAKVSDRG